MASKKSTRKILTGQQLRFAAENGIPVFYEEMYENPHDKHMNYAKACVMKPAQSGYYIGNSDINPDDFEPTEICIGEFPEGNFRVTGVVGYEYQPNPSSK
jgi:hypothetical protein